MGASRELRRLLVAAVAAALPLITVVPALAADAVDQKQTIDSGANTLRSPMAQTFTAGSSGQVDRISLEQTFAIVTERVQLQGVTGGKPNGSVLGSSSFTGALGCCRRWQDFTFNPTVNVTAGTQYAIVVVPSSNITWYDSQAFDAYTQGQLWLMVNGSWSFQTSFGRDFTFQEWVTSGASNRPPVLSAANGVLTANEGSTATDTGTYSDPDGDNVALSASEGTLTKSGNSAGSWSWSLAGADEAPVQTVTITASDGKGGTSSVSFTVTFLPVPPTLTFSAGPTSGPEGSPVTLTGQATSPSAADQQVGFNYSWSVSKNGGQFASGTGATPKFTPDDEGTYVVSLQAVDDGGNGASANYTVTGTNVAPTATLSKPAFSGIVLLPDAPVTFDGGFTDPGALDTHTTTFNYGDGTPSETDTYGASGSAETIDNYAFPRAGTFTVTYTATDDDGGTSTATVQVTVDTPAQALGVIQNYLAGIASLGNGDRNGLMAKYRAAAASAARGDDNATCGQLGAALNDLSAMTANGSLSAADSAALSSATWSVHRALGCTKVKVGWLNLAI